MATMAWVLTTGLYGNVEIVAVVVGTEDEANEAAKAISIRRQDSDIVFVTYESTPLVNKQGETI